MKLAETLKRLRKEKGLTIVELAEKADVAQGTIGNIERGANKATPKMLESLAKALQLNKKERVELYASTLPEDIAKKLERVGSLELSQYERTVGEASSFFRNESVSEEDKKKMLDVITELFIDAKLKNKEKYRKK